MLTLPVRAALLVVAVVCVVGWPLLGMIGYAWLDDVELTDPLWWAVGVTLGLAFERQAALSLRLWRSYLDPRR